MELNRIKGKIAFISGASSGIGKAVAVKLAQMGANLILCARRAEVLAELKTQLEKEHKGKDILVISKLSLPLCSKTNEVLFGELSQFALFNS